MQKMNISKKVALVGILSATATAISFLENAVSAFLPFGIKIGLSNIIVMFSAAFCGFPLTLCIVVIKSFFVLMTRGAFAFLMSISGGVISACVIFIMLKKTRENFGFLGIGISGALAYNISQLFAAYIVMGNPVLYYVPIFSVISLLTGALTGFAIYILINRLTKNTSFMENSLL